MYDESESNSGERQNQRGKRWRAVAARERQELRAMSPEEKFDIFAKLMFSMDTPEQRLDSIKEQRKNRQLWQDFREYYDGLPKHG